ncbi:MAG: hypothetical protein ACYC5K_13570, partial [Saccharofermentanales bacterium]
FWFENGGMGGLPYFIDDIKVVENDIEAVPTATPVPEPSIEDNEQGWVNTDIRFNGTDWLNNSIFLAAGETAGYDADGDGFSVAWNYSMYAAVNAGAYDFLVKNLEEPVVGGTFEFYFWVRDAGGVDANGLKIEAIAYEADGTAYSLGTSGAVSPKLGTPSGAGDTNWFVYSNNMPADKKIVKMELRLYNGAGAATVWGVVNIDKISFKNTTTGSYDRISELGWTPVARTSETPTVANGSLAYSHEGDSVIVLSGGVTPDLEYLKTITMSKTLDTALTDGYLEYKVYMDAFNSSINSASHTKTRAVAYDSAGTAYDLGASDGIIRYGAWMGGSLVYGGWNQYRALLPAGVAITRIEISIFWFENGGMGGLPYFIDDIKVVENDIEAVPTATPEPTAAVTPDPTAGVTPDPTAGVTPDPTPTDVPAPTPTDTPVPTPTSVPLPTPTLPPVEGVYLQTETFIPDDLTSSAGDRENLNDNEFNWYTDEILINGDKMLDGSRIFDYDATATSGWQVTENKYVRTETDDNYSTSLMFEVGHPLIDRDYDIKYKDLQAPVKGGKFSFYVWFRNGYPQNHNVFALEAVAYDKDGKAYSLGQSDVLSWSGDERYFTAPEDPNVAIMSGWQYYEGIMPKDIEIVKMGIMLVNTMPGSTAAIGPSYNNVWYAEDWTVFDEIKFTDTIIMDSDILFDDETKWVSDEAILTGLDEYLFPWLKYDDKTIEIDTSFNSFGNDNVAVINRDLDNGITGGTFSFKLFNQTNSNLAGEPRYKVSVLAYDENGLETDLGDCTPGDFGNDYLKFSGLPGIAYIFNGYSTLTVDLPADSETTRISIVITETTEATLSSALFYLDDVKFIGTLAAEPGEATPTPTATAAPTQTPGENPQTSDSGTAFPAFMILALLAITVFSSKMIYSKKKNS